MNKDFQHIDDTLLVKFLLKETNNDENELVESWLKQSDANRKYFNDFEKTWNLSSSQIDIDVDKAWANVKSRTAPKSHKIFIYTSVAASILVLLAFLGIFKTSEPQPIIYSNVGEEVKSILLPDSSEVLLYAHSEVQYLFNEKESVRSVNMDGKVFFKVHKNVDQPFKINVDVGAVEVLGTQFMIDNRPQDEITVDVLSGKVRVDHSLSDDQIILTKGMSASINKVNPQIIEFNQASDVFYSVNGYLHFVNENIVSVFETLSHTYNVDIQLSESVDTSLMFTSSFDNLEFDSVLDIICTAMKFEHRLDNNSIVIYDLD